MSILFFKPIPRKALWGKTLVKDYFDYNDFDDGIGQAWAFSAQIDYSNKCITEPYVGKTLLELWQNHQELFGHPEEEFPVIISLVGPQEDLSIQVHPDDAYAHREGLPSGKNEAWYFIEAKDNYNIVYGHHAKDKDDLSKYVQQEKWNDLIKYLDVKKGDFVYLPAGLLHALREGSIVYEIQQAVDVTYRFYDYHRKDDKGKERELHLHEAIDCLSYNPLDMENNIMPQVRKYKNCQETIFISNESFTVTQLIIDGEYHCRYSNYQLVTIVKGEGLVNNHKVKLGDNFLIPQNTDINICGKMILMMTTK